MADEPRALFATMKPFSPSDPQSRDSLWVTNGTVGGTYKLVDGMYPQDAEDRGAGARDFGVVGNEVLFASTDPAHGDELWVTDGTLSGTSLLKDINLGPGNAEPYEFIPISSGAVLFSADDGAGGELWITDGTSSGHLCDFAKQQSLLLRSLQRWSAVQRF